MNDCFQYRIESFPGFSPVISCGIQFGKFFMRWERVSYPNLAECALIYPVAIIIFDHIVHDRVLNVIFANGADWQSRVVFYCHFKRIPGIRLISFSMRPCPFPLREDNHQD